MMNESFYKTKPSAVHEYKSDVTLTVREVAFLKDKDDTFMQNNRQIQLEPFEDKTFYRVNEEDHSILVAAADDERYRLTYDDKLHFKEVWNWLETNAHFI